MYMDPYQKLVPAPAPVRACSTCPARSHGLCRTLEEADVEALRACCSTRRLTADTALFHEGDPAREVATIVRGVVRLSQLLPDGRRHLVAFAFPGDFLGVTLEDEQHFTAESVGHAEICVLPKARFERFVQDHPYMAKPLFSAAAQELSAAREQMVLLGRKTAAERLATFLLRMADRTPQKLGQPVRVLLPMSRTDIADHLGLRIETVCRELAILRAAQLIEMKGAKEILLIDHDALHERAIGASYH